MQRSPGKKVTAVGEDGAAPTEYQIRSGHFVVPASFYEAHKNAIPWTAGFDVVAFGVAYNGKKIDQDRRLNVRLREHIVPGDVIRLRIEGGTLYVVRETKPV